MDARSDGQPTTAKNRATVERKSEREIVITRTINGPARIVFEASCTGPRWRPLVECE